MWQRERPSAMLCVCHRASQAASAEPASIQSATMGTGTNERMCVHTRRRRAHTKAARTHARTHSSVHIRAHTHTRRSLVRVWAPRAYTTVYSRCQTATSRLHNTHTHAHTYSLSPKFTYSSTAAKHFRIYKTRACATCCVRCCVTPTTTTTTASQRRSVGCLFAVRAGCLC